MNSARKYVFKDNSKSTSLLYRVYLLNLMIKLPGWCCYISLLCPVFILILLKLIRALNRQAEKFVFFFHQEVKYSLLVGNIFYKFSYMFCGCLPGETLCVIRRAWIVLYLQHIYAQEILRKVRILQVQSIFLCSLPVI